MCVPSDLRNNERVMWQSTEDVWGPIYERVAPHLPSAVHTAGSDWMPYGLNERLRFYRCKRCRSRACVCVCV
jgi:hypothetical protein